MKPSGRVWQPIVLLAMLTLYVLAISGCDSKPTDPAPKEATDYIAYFADINSDNYVFGYHILSGQLDSFQVPALPPVHSNHLLMLKPKLVVSADGRKLFVGLDDSVLIVDFDHPTNVEVVAVPAGEGIATSTDGAYYSILGSGGVHILNTSDNSLVFHDTDQVLWGQFSHDNQTFYATARDEYVYRVDFEDASNSERIYCTEWHLGQAVPNHSETGWFLRTHDDNCSAAMELYDVDESTTLERHRYGGWGEMELSPDGTCLPFSHPPLPWSVCGGGSSSFSVFDTRSNSITKIDIVLDSADVDIHHDLPYMPILDVEVTPDGMWFVVSGRDIIAVVDAASFEVRGYKILYGKQIVYLTIQNSL